MINNLTPFQKEALLQFDDELKMCMDFMFLNWIEKPVEEMSEFKYTSLEALCEYFEVNYNQFCRILRNNGILDKNNKPTEFGIKTGIVMRTPFGNPGMN